MEMDQLQPKQFFERSLGELLSETLTIYSRQFVSLILLVIVIQIPMSLIGLAIWLTVLPSPQDLDAALSALDENMPDAEVFALLGDLFIGLLPWIVLYLVCTTLLATFMYAAGTYAVCRHYLTDGVSALVCYQRAWWHIVSIIGLGILWLLLVFVGTALFWLVVPLVLMIALIVYWSVALQSIIVERLKPIEALRRSFRLVSGNWWRVFGIWLVLILMVMGLSIVVGVVFGIVGNAVGGGAEIVIDSVDDFIAGLVTAPFLFIASTLIYLDLRARSEAYGMDDLAQDLGMTPLPPDGPTSLPPNQPESLPPGY